jgi:hypothetical protein
MCCCRSRDSNEYERNQRDWDVHPDDRSPRPLGEIATEHRADSGESTGDAEEYRQRLPALSESERLDDDCQRGREHDRPTRSLDDAKADEPSLGQSSLRRQAAHRRRAREDDDAEHHHSSMPDGVAKAASEREKRR